MRTIRFFFMERERILKKTKKQQRDVSWKSRRFMAVNTQFLKVEIVAPNDVLDFRKNAWNTMKRKIKREWRFKNIKNYR